MINNKTKNRFLLKSVLYQTQTFVLHLKFEQFSFIEFVTNRFICIILSVIHFLYSVMDNLKADKFYDVDSEDI